MQSLLAYWNLYLMAVAAAFGISFILTPVVRQLALRFGWMDAPSSSVKTHKVTTPSLGGIAIVASFVITLLLLRYLTQFPTGTLRSLRGLLVGGVLVFLLGVVDDLKKPNGLHFKTKFFIQSLAACCLLFFDIRLQFIKPDYMAAALTLLWVVGITNAFNIIDIMDGLSASQAAIAALGFLMISLPSEELYVNFASAILAGAALGFLPWNLSRKHKIFMGDSGSMTLGFVLAAVSLGTRYSDVNDLGVFAPLLILLVPMYDTLFVMYLRFRKGQSPFLGSKDHFALRLEKVGYGRGQVVALAAAVAALLGFCAFLVTQLSLFWSICIYVGVAVEGLLLSKALAKVDIK
ncbi:MAG: MraY family glycosyltransferase [Elusimicrobiota bacterium]|jgi:UDP-GlcNAc:undecaprenyl-phosphate GlcNAc-1-phosphate transferase